MSALPLLAQTVLKHPQRWSGLEMEIRRVELTLAAAPEEILDRCKTLCEIVIKTILVAAGSKTEEECEHLDMEGLKILVGTVLVFDEEDLIAIKAEMQYLTRSRNKRGLAGHGRSLQKQKELRGAIDERMNTRALGITDSLLSHLIEKFEIQFPYTASTVHSRDVKFDNYLDDLFGVLHVFETDYAASDVLYHVDPIAYADGIRQYKDTEQTEPTK